MADNFTNADIVYAKIRVRRGTNSELAQRIYDAGEILYSTDKKRVRIGDSVTYGGVLAGNKVYYVNDLTNASTIERYDLLYRYDLSTFYLLTGTNYLSLSSYIPLNGNSLSDYTLPIASSTILGGIKISSGLSIDGSGLVSVSVDGSTLQIQNNALKVNINQVASQVASAVAPSIATSSTAGVVKIGDTIDIIDGKISVQIDNKTIRYASNQLYVDVPSLSTLTLNNGVIDTGISRLVINNASGLVLDVASSSLSVGVADSDSVGGVMLGQGLSGNVVGKVDVPLAKVDRFGGGILGKGLSSNPATNTINVLVDDDSIRLYDDGTTKYLYSHINRNHPAVAKAWICFDGTGTNGTYQTIYSKYGDLSAYKNTTGVYTISWPMSLSAAGTYYKWDGNAKTGALGTMFVVSLSSQNLTSTCINVVQHSGSPASADSSVINFSFNTN
jgi:hypothetical protein